MKKEQEGNKDTHWEEGEHIAHDQLLASYAQGTADEQVKAPKGNKER